MRKILLCKYGCIFHARFTKKSMNAALTIVDSAFGHGVSRNVHKQRMNNVVCIQTPKDGRIYKPLKFGKGRVEMLENELRSILQSHLPVWAPFKHYFYYLLLLHRRVFSPFHFCLSRKRHKYGFTKCRGKYHY